MCLCVSKKMFMLLFVHYQHSMSLSNYGFVAQSRSNENSLSTEIKKA
jgi:hypothetical protein